MEERHAKEEQLWAEMKVQYEARARGHASKINTFKLSLDEMRAKTNMGTKRIRTLLHMHRDRFENQLTEALAKGWAGGHNKPRNFTPSARIMRPGQRRERASSS